METNDIIDTFEVCKKRWEIQDNQNRFFSRYPEWVQEMPEALAEIINSLMQGFDYYSHSMVNRKLKISHKDLQEMCGVEFNNTIYCVLPNKKGRINSGYEYLIEYRYLNELSKYVVFPNLKEVPQEYFENIENIVFIDDFCGTGKTFKDYIKTVEEIVQGKKIYYLVIHIMQKAIENIKEYGESRNLSIHVLYQTCTLKAFERNFQLSEQRDEFKNLSIECGVSTKDVFGFKNTEALVAFYNDTPNNTLGIFWKNTEKNNALFPRVNDKKPDWMEMRKAKKSRNASNYLNGSNV